jgi:hypothetical protein
MAVSIATWRSYSHERSSNHTKVPEYMTNRSRSIFKGHGLESVQPRCRPTTLACMGWGWIGRMSPIGYHMSTK